MSAAPEEVVTRALLREVRVPLDGHDAVRVALVTLDNGEDHRRPTTFGPGGLAELDATFAEVQERAAEFDAVAVTGKPFVFAVGADLTLLGAMRTREDVLAIGARGHAVFARLADLPIPSFAFINGPALGGGLELALHCTHRTVSRGVVGGPAGLALPEVSLGIVPAWGGAWLLPHLVGPEHAVTVAVENPLAQNRQLDANRAVELGVADVALDPADFVAESLRWAAGVVRGRVAVERPDVRRDAGAWSAAVARGRAIADGRTHGSAPAPYRALDLIEAARTSNRRTGFAAEDEALADLVLSPEARSSLYAFDLVQRRAKRPVGAPDPEFARTVTKVGVVGAGLMARQLALLAAGRLGVPVVMRDQDDERVRAGLDAIEAEVATLAARKTFDDDKANRVRAAITAGTDWSVFADCDLVIEAVYEDLGVKQEVFAELEAVVRPDCVLATNTSALSVTEMAERCTYPERVVGLHFFNPVAVLPLVEVVRIPSTDDATLATAFAVAKALGKSAIAVADAPGFVVNRLLTAFIGAATAAVADGAEPQDVEDAILAIGVPMGPFQLVELVGPAVARHVAVTMAAAYPDRFAEPALLDVLVEQGITRLTVTEHGRTRIDPDVAAVLTTGSMSTSEPGPPPSADAVRARALAALAAEVEAILAEGVVGDAREIDLGLLLGAGWPFHLGGITPYLARLGSERR